MRVICPTCEQSSVLCVEALSAEPARSSCARCGVCFEIALLVKEAGAHATPFSMAARGAFQRPDTQETVWPISAVDVVALPRERARADDASFRDHLSVLDLDNDFLAHAHAAHADRYGLAVQLMNASPLWLLASGLAFVSFVVLCNWLISSDASRMDSSLSAFKNDATNRSATRTRDASAFAELARDSAAHAGDEPAADDLVQAPSPDERFGTQTERQTGGQSAVRPAAKLTIQIGSYGVVEEAEAEAANLRAAGFAARVVEKRVAKRVWYCVQTGVFESREELEQHRARLREKGFAADSVTREVE